jgi:hypothetical protein
MILQNFIKKLTGIDKIEAEVKQLRLAKEEAERVAAEKAAETARLEQQMIDEKIAQEAVEVQARKTPKEIATERGEPWVAVLDTKVNPENPRNGFFELDWNNIFVLQLKQAGYGYDGDPDEEIVDRWFRDLAYNMLQEEGIDPTRGAGAGFINVIPIDKGRSEVS